MNNDSNDAELAEARALARERATVIARLRERIARLERREGELTSALESVGRSQRELDPPRFYVVGHAKSGTTWLMRMLDAHPDLLCRGEGRLFGFEYQRPDLLEGNSAFQPSSLYRALAGDEYLRAWVERSVWTREGDRDAQLKALTRAAIRQVLGAALIASGKTAVGDKTPLLTRDTIAEIAGVDPGARVIHIIRDGRDVAVSGIHHLWNRELDLAGSNDLTAEETRMRDEARAVERGATRPRLFTDERMRQQAESWRDLVTSARQQGSELLGARYLEVRYEALVDDPHAVLRTVLTLLEAHRDPEVLRRAVSAASFRRWSGGRRRGEEDSTELLRKGIVGDWTNAFTAEDRRIFATAAGALLVGLGYEADDSWAGPEGTPR